MRSIARGAQPKCELLRTCEPQRAHLLRKQGAHRTIRRNLIKSMVYENIVNQPSLSGVAHPMVRNSGCAPRFLLYR